MCNSIIYDIVEVVCAFPLSLSHQALFLTDVPAAARRADCSRDAILSSKHLSNRKTASFYTKVADMKKAPHLTETYYYSICEAMSW